MNLMCKLLLWAVMISFLALGAKANEPEPFRGIWCDTAEQIARVVTEGTKLGGAAEGIKAVNATDENACVYGTILGTRIQRHRAIPSPDGMLDIVEWKVSSVATPYGIIEVEKVWFTLEASTAREA